MIKISKARSLSILLVESPVISLRRAKHIKASPRVRCNEDHYAKSHGASHATKDESMERILNKLRERLDVEDVNLLEELLILEGIFFDPSVEESEQAIEDVTMQTISALHQAVEDLVCTTKELKRENKALKARVAAAERLNALQTEAVENGNTNVVQKISDLLSVFVSQCQCLTLRWYSFLQSNEAIYHS
ncbi:hypothetical protein Q3G72_023111 [Acer saccharum]|nr:hypothetical protein Q3G72_023111 [Acer saccharum]